MGKIVIAICGQSQASGRGTAPYTAVANASLTSLWTNEDALDAAWSDPHDADVAGNSGNIDYDAAAAGSMAPAISNYLTARGKEVVIVACAKGSSGLYSASPDGTYWGYRNESDHDDDTTLYGNSVKNLNAAIAAVGAENVDKVWVVWDQGTTDAEAAVSRSNYATQLTTLIGWYREDVSATLKFCISNIGVDLSAPASPAYHAIRMAQRDVADAVADVFRTKDAREVDCIDNFHYSTAGNLVQGNRIAAAIYSEASYMPSFGSLDLTNCVCLIGGTMMQNASNTPANTNANNYQVPCYQGESALATINPAFTNFAVGTGWVAPQFIWNNGAGSFNNYISFGDITNFNTASKYTIELWCKLDDITATEYIYQKRTDNNNMVSSLISGGFIYVYNCNGGAQYGRVATEGLITNDTYFHMVVAYDGTLADNATRLKLYINNVQQTLTFTGTIPATTVDLTGVNFLLGAAANSMKGGSAVDACILYDDADVNAAGNYSLGRGYGGLKLSDQGDGTALFVFGSSANALGIGLGTTGLLLRGI